MRFFYCFENNLKIVVKIFALVKKAAYICIITSPTNAAPELRKKRDMMKTFATVQECINSLRLNVLTDKVMVKRCYTESGVDIIGAFDFYFKHPHGEEIFIDRSKVEKRIQIDANTPVIRKSKGSVKAALCVMANGKAVAVLDEDAVDRDCYIWNTNAYLVGTRYEGLRNKI